MKKKYDIPTIEDSVKALKFTVDYINSEGYQYTLGVGKDDDGKDVIYVYLEEDIDFMIESIDGYRVIKKVVGKIAPL